MNPSPGRPPGPWRQRARWVLLALLALPLAWVVSNLFDVAPQPRPALLAAPVPRLAAAENLYGAWVALQGVVPGPSGPPWVCTADGGDCYPGWLADPEALERQRQVLAPLGERCEAWADGPLGFEEPWPQPMTTRAPVAMHLTVLGHCGAWLRSGAALAAARGQRELALLQLQRGDRLWRRVLAGSQSLTAQMISMRVTREHWRSLAALVVHDASLASELAPLVADGPGWPDEAATIRRWMVFEAAFIGAAFDEVAADCGGVFDGLSSLPEGLRRVLCSAQVGFHPERTRQASDAAWLARIAAFEGADPAVRWLQRDAAQRDTGAAESPPPMWTRLHWRNPVGEMLLAVAGPSYDAYFARHADFALHRRATALAVAVQAQGVAAASRAAWLAAQPLAPHERTRLSFSADGHALTARPWQKDAGAIVIRWPH